MSEKNQPKRPVVVGPNFLGSWFIYNFEVCNGVEALKSAMEQINRHGYDVVSVTQAGRVYTVFFRRRACG